MMSLFRRKSEKSSFKSHSGSGLQAPVNVANGGTASWDSSSISSLEDKSPPLLAFAEATFNPASPMKTKSRLTKSLEEVLHDNGALAYFIQFMDAQGAKHLIKFWLEAESFRASALTRLKGCSQSERLSPEDKNAGLPGPLASSDSSGCVSDKSDDVFQSSSRGDCCDSMNKCSCARPLSGPSTGLLEAGHRPVREVIVNGAKRESNFTEKSERHQQVQVIGVVGSNCDVSRTKAERHSITDSNIHKQSSVNVNSVNSTFNSVKSVSSKSSNAVETHCTEKFPDGDVKTKDAKVTLSTSGINVKLKTSMEQDALHIYSKYIAQDALHPIGVDDDLRNQIVASICTEDGRVDPDSFLLAQKFVVEKMDSEYFPTFLRSNFPCKHQIDMLTSDSVILADILYNESALFYFMEFMEQEGVRHLVDFLLMADNFRDQLSKQKGKYDPNQAQDDAMVLYDKYFSLQATSSLGFSDQIRYEVEQNICREEGPLPDCFTKPVMIIMQYLEKTYLTQFLNSQLCLKYMSECITTIQSGNDFIGHRTRSGSESSSSEHSLPVHTVNTLLAMDSKQPGAPTRILKNIGDEDMRIDTGQFHPDSLWKRTLAGKLQMTHVGEYGKLVSEFEPEPDRKKEFKLSKAMRRLVNRDEDKTQEEMAWQVAEMIVKGVCSVTLGDGEVPPDVAGLPEDIL